MVLETLQFKLQAEPNLIIVGATSPDRALAIAAQSNSYVVVFTIDAADSCALETVQALRNQLAAAPLVLLASGFDEQLERKALDLGCSALITRGHSINDLVAALKAASKGDMVFPIAVLNRLKTRSSQAKGASDLTERELQVLALLAEGYSTAGIANRLTISHYTVRNHVRNVLAKLNSHTRLEAVVKGHALGLVELISDLAPERASELERPL
jgi:DNA-binding NarL/FixJ family response regulator